MGLATAALAGLAVLLGTWAASTRDNVPAGKHPSLALFTSLPIYWPEAADVASRLSGGAPPHWARAVLERSWRLVPLDLIEQPALLAGHSRLLMAQPRPLTPGENVALDAWVRRGGRLLLFADPALTTPSVFALGDRRRPQDTVLLSPILDRWGLELRFSEAQPPGGSLLPLKGGATLPVRLAGHFAITQEARAHGCDLTAGAVIATCAIGRGRLVAVADAALFEAPGDASDERLRGRVLAWLARQAFGNGG